MLIEQAFYALPETLVGSGYAKQEYEASIVSAFSMALLGELNGRNVANPMSCIRAERKFMSNYGNLRADLNVKLSGVLTGSKALSQMGFRFDNWIEAKFFRGKVASTQNLGQVAADLVRLAGLVPLEPGSDQKLPHGRYLLHAHLGDPLVFLAPRRKGRDAPDRQWVQPLLAPGRQSIASLELDNESQTFNKFLGPGLKTCLVKLDLTNFVAAPPPTTNQPFYTLVLTRLDAGSIEFGGRKFEFRDDRSFLVHPEGEYEQLRRSVADALKPDKSDVPTAAEELEVPEV
ncbi:MAG: hypothetical protein AB1898_32885 [Acidobacteriota bacterium]